MRTFRGPTINEYTGFDRDGRYVGSASFGFVGSVPGQWRLNIVGEDERYVKHEDEALDALIEAGAVTLKSSDGRKY